MKLNIGIIGCGLIGNKRFKNLSNHFKLIACSDINLKNAYKLSKDKKVKKFKNWKKIFEIKKLDAVIISTYHASLSKILDYAVKKKVNSFVEKPVATNPKSIDKIINLNKKNKVKIRVGFNHRFHPAIIKAKAIIKKGNLGEIMYIRSNYGHGGRIDYNKEWRFNYKLSGGGELIDKGSHLIDLCRYFIGELKLVACDLNTFYWNTKLEDNCFLILKNHKSSRAFLHSSCTEWKNKFTFEIFCKYGKIEVNGLGRSYGIEKLTLYKMKKNLGKPSTKTWIFKKDESWKIEMNEFYKDIKLNRDPNPGLKDAIKNLYLIKKIYKLN